MSKYRSTAQSWPSGVRCGDGGCRGHFVPQKSSRCKHFAYYMELAGISWSYLLWEWKQWSSVLNTVVNCFPKYVAESKIEGIIDVTWRRGRRSKQLLDDFREKTDYWKLIRGRTISSSVDNSLWKAYGLVVMNTKKWMTEKSVSTLPIKNYL
jgi:hypothetical protein